MNGLSVALDATRALTRLDRLPEAIGAAIRDELAALSEDLADAARRNLSGAVLNQRSGALYNAVRANFSADPLTARVSIDDSVPYAAIQEYGGQTSPHDIVAGAAKALAFAGPGGTQLFHSVHHPGSKIPERSYLGSALADMTNDIVERLTRATCEGAT